MKKGILGILVGAALGTAAGAGIAKASTFYMHFETHNVSVSSTSRHNIAVANSWAVNKYLRGWWHTRFVVFDHNPQDIRIILTTKRGMANFCGDGAAACHGVDPASGKPIIVVGKFDPYYTLYTSHEVDETMVDPYVNRISRSAHDGRARYVEVCDPVEDWYFKDGHNPALLSDFATPAWFTDGRRPYDVLSVLTRGAPYTTQGGYDPLADNASVARGQQRIHQTRHGRVSVIPPHSGSIR